MPRFAPTDGRPGWASGAVRRSPPRTSYVAQLEAERGPSTVEEYARLLSATERGTIKETLAALDVSKVAAPRVHRGWLLKIRT